MGGVESKERKGRVREDDTNAGVGGGDESEERGGRER